MLNFRVVLTKWFNSISCRFVWFVCLRLSLNNRFCQSLYQGTPSSACLFGFKFNGSLRLTSWEICFQSKMCIEPLAASASSLQTITQQKTLTTHLFSHSLQPTTTFTYKLNQNVWITTHHPHYQSKCTPEHHYICWISSHHLTCTQVL